MRDISFREPGRSGWRRAVGSSVDTFAAPLTFVEGDAADVGGEGRLDAIVANGNDACQMVAEEFKR